MPDRSTLTVGRIAEAIGAEAEGEVSLPIKGAAEPGRAGPTDLAIALAPNWAALLARGSALAALLWPGADWRALGLRAAILAPRGRLAMARLTGLLEQAPYPAGIHLSAVVDETARIGDGVGIGPFSTVGAGAKIGKNTLIGPHVMIAPGARLGPDCVIHAGVRIGSRVAIGSRVVVQPNAVIGSDGFAFVTAEPSNVELARASLGRAELARPGSDPRWHKIQSLGGVDIGDDVEVGSGTTIDAGTLRATQIGQGTKIDNQVLIGHNVVIGQHCLLCGQVGIAGSARIGDRVVLAGQAGVSDNISLGDDVVVSGGAGVTSNVPDGRVVMGTPAFRLDHFLESYKAFRRLPRIVRDLAAGVPKSRRDG
jgi:UDP-3-O-[3-hydroxymyristoyl] glucosamine N-acyltransferase